MALVGRKSLSFGVCVTCILARGRLIYSRSEATRHTIRSRGMRSFSTIRWWSFSRIDRKLKVKMPEMFSFPLQLLSPSLALPEKKKLRNSNLDERSRIRWKSWQRLVLLPFSRLFPSDWCGGKIVKSISGHCSIHYGNVSTRRRKAETRFFSLFGVGMITIAVSENIFITREVPRYEAKFIKIRNSEFVRGRTNESTWLRMIRDTSGVKGWGSDSLRSLIMQQPKVVHFAASTRNLVLGRAFIVPREFVYLFEFTSHFLLLRLH